MSYWIYLKSKMGEEGEALPVQPHWDGGTIKSGGEDTAILNVTYNYVEFFDFAGLHGRTGADTIRELAGAVEKLGVEVDPDYWAKTEGNAGAACATLLSWAIRHPEGVWEVH
jgi:hypothetical protein